MPARQRALRDCAGGATLQMIASQRLTQWFGLLCLLSQAKEAEAWPWSRSQGAATMAEGSALGQRDPYHVIQFQLEEGGDDPVNTRRGWEEAKAETKRVAQMVEREQRTTAKIEATLAV